MEKVLVIGSCGAGKSTFSKKLQNKVNLPIIHLDQHYHLENWEEPKKEEWEAKLKQLVKGNKWIMDGNYASSFDIRFPYADTIIYLDYPTYKSFWRTIKRIVKYYGKQRSDTAIGCKERFDLDFLKYVLTFNTKNRKPILSRLEKENKDIFIFKSDKEADLFLEMLDEKMLS